MTRQSPTESATEFKVGTRKVGLDNNKYYVLKDKNCRKRWVKEGCWFVMYKINPDSKVQDWVYSSNFPGNWDWIGGGTTMPINSRKVVKYPREEQFMGSPDKSHNMRRYLSKYFSTLKAKGIVEHFRIVTSAGLRRYMDVCR